MKKRLFSLLLCLSFVLALVPTAAMAGDAETDPLKPEDLYYTLTGDTSTADDAQVTLSKTAKDNGDGTYTVTLTAEAAETVSTKPTEVVFLLDTSGSMRFCADGRADRYHCDDSWGVSCWRVEHGITKSRLDEAKSAISTVVSNLSKNENTTMKYVYFGGHQVGNYWTYDAEVVNNYDNITKGNGGTPLTLGTKKALEQFTAGDHNKVLIIVADGDSDDNYPNKEIREFQKNGGIVYTVGFTFSSDKFEALASKNGNYTANNANELKVAMNEITSKVAGLISDTMGEGVKLIPGTVNATGDGYDNAKFWTSEDGKTIYWTNQAGLSKKVTLTYDVKLTSAAIEAAQESGDEIPLNKEATLSYEMGDETLHLKFPVPKVHLDTLKEYTLTYVSNGGTEYPSETYKESTEVPMRKSPTREGYTFLGWYDDAELTQKVTMVTMDSNKTVYAGWKEDDTPDLEKGDHSAYIVGYEDGTVRPQNNITRAEVAAIFYRLLTDDARKAGWATTNHFSDVESGTWYNNGISTLANMGILHGYEDDSFRPDAYVTRAEFATIAANFSDGAMEEYADFTDVPKTHWASKYIAKAASLGWIYGDGDGKFRPEAYITRAEAMSFVNRVLKRGVDKEGLSEDAIQWRDNADLSAWYYYDVLEATNSHEYARTDRPIKNQIFCAENWVKLKENRDWKAMEAEWEKLYGED